MLQEVLKNTTKLAHIKDSHIVALLTNASEEFLADIVMYYGKAENDKEVQYLRHKLSIPWRAVYRVSEELDVIKERALWISQMF